jgi:predicted RNA-binding Zn ribbon-like protein
MSEGGPRSFSRIGGHVALDFLNTVEWRLDPQRATEDLPDYESILAWSRQCDILSETESADLRRRASAEGWSHVAEEHRRFLQLRETAYAALVQNSPKAADRLRNVYRDTLHNARLRQVGPNWTWFERSVTLRTPHDRVTHHVIALLTSPDLGQLHQCEDAACGWVYLDTSRRRNRRWCAAADCGNRNRARRYYARRRTQSTPPALGSDSG